jgi:hypothetical protein
MIRLMQAPWGLYLTGLYGIALVAGAASGEDAVLQRPLDVGKRAIEAAPKKLLAQATSTAPSAPAATALSRHGRENPKVQPGLVHWHPAIADACAAARRSGKPVLLFQMMGNLDEKFC